MWIAICYFCIMIKNKYIFILIHVYFCNFLSPGAITHFHTYITNKDYNMSIWTINDIFLWEKWSKSVYIYYLGPERNTTYLEGAFCFLYFSWQLQAMPGLRQFKIIKMCLDSREFLIGISLDPRVEEENQKHLSRKIKNNCSVAKCTVIYRTPQQVKRYNPK